MRRLTTAFNTVTGEVRIFGGDYNKRRIKAALANAAKWNRDWAISHNNEPYHNKWVFAHGASDDEMLAIIKEKYERIHD